MKKLAIAIMLGIGVMVSGCGNNATHQTQQVKQVCTYNNVNLKDMGTSSASRPVIDNGMTFSFNQYVKFNGKKVDVVDR
mgnify:FL=1